MPPSWRSSRHAPYPEPDLDNTDPNEEVALQSPSTRRHHRSKTVRRAAKRQRGELASQREVIAKLHKALQAATHEASKEEGRARHRPARHRPDRRRPCPPVQVQPGSGGGGP